MTVVCTWWLILSIWSAIVMSCRTCILWKTGTNWDFSLETSFTRCAKGSRISLSTWFRLRMKPSRKRPWRSSSKKLRLWSKRLMKVTTTRWTSRSSKNISQSIRICWSVRGITSMRWLKRRLTLLWKSSFMSIRKSITTSGISNLCSCDNWFHFYFFIYLSHFLHSLYSKWFLIKISIIFIFSQTYLF